MNLNFQPVRQTTLPPMGMKSWKTPATHLSNCIQAPQSSVQPLLLVPEHLSTPGGGHVGSPHSLLNEGSL